MRYKSIRILRYILSVYACRTQMNANDTSIKILFRTLQVSLLAIIYDVGGLSCLLPYTSHKLNTY